MAQTPQWPVPALLSKFVRHDPVHGREEAAAVYCNVKPNGEWRVVLITDENAYHPLDSGRFAQSIKHADWRPFDAVWDAETRQFSPPDQQWDVEKGGWAKRKTPAPASSLPTIDEIPVPEAEEHPNAWRSRVKRKFPELATDEGSTFLSEAWRKLTQG